MNRKRVAVTLAVFGLVASACGGSSTADGGTDTTSGDKVAFSDENPYGTDFDPSLRADSEYQIGVSLQQEKANFWKAVKEGSVDAGTRTGALEPVFADGNKDAEKQADDVRKMIEEGYDGIVLGATDSTAAENIVTETAAAGVPVIAVALQVGDPDSYGANAVHPDTIGLVTNDDVALGSTAAEFVVPVAAQKGAQLNIVILEGTPGAANTTLRSQGFTDALDDKQIDYLVTASQPGNFAREDGETACAEMLSSDDTIDLIFSQSDEMTIGCVKALEADGRELPIASIGGNEEGIAMVADGSVLGTVCQKPATMGAVATQLMVRHLNGENLAGEVFFYQTPAVTADNLEDCVPEW